MRGSLYVYLGDDAALAVRPTASPGDYRLMLGDSDPSVERTGHLDVYVARVDRRRLEQLHELLGEFLAIDGEEQR